MASMEIAEASVELQAAVHGRYRREIHVRVLSIYIPDPLAGTVDVLGPRVRGRYLKPSRKTPFRVPLHGVIRRIALAGPNPAWSKIRVQRSGPRIHKGVGVHTGRELVADSTDVCSFDHHLTWKLSLHTKRPSFG